jgi:hypothetical protein
MASFKAVLLKELQCWDELDPLSQDGLVEAEQSLAYPLCLDSDDFSSAVSCLSNVLEAELKKRIYVPILSLARVEGISLDQSQRSFGSASKP